MRINHVAMWVVDLEKMKTFYEKYFHGKAGQRYHNPAKNFSSYFLTFDNDCRLEIMSRTDIHPSGEHKEKVGFSHLAISVGSKDGVNSLTEMLRADGFVIVGEPRTTGDGYYESVVLDPESNRIEITI